MKTRRFKQGYRENASSGHIKFGEALKRIFPLNKRYQEYPYSMILKKGYSTYLVPEANMNTALEQEARKYHADWVILDLCIILEYQGEHHYYAIDYLGDFEKAQAALARRQYIDKKKREIANEAGFLLIEIPYFEDDISDDELIDMISQELLQNKGGLDENIQKELE